MVNVIFDPENSNANFARAMEITEMDFKLQFESFIRNFNITNEENMYFDTVNRTAYYIEQLKKAVEGSSVIQLDNFQVSLKHIHSVNPQLVSIIIKNPADCIIYMDEILSDIANEEYKDMQIHNLLVKVSLIQHPEVLCMRNLGPSHIETLVAFRGIVIRSSSILPDMRIACFRCISRSVPNQQPGTICGHEETIPLTAGEIQEPQQCPRCNAKHSFELYHGRCVFGNKQLLKIQETLETIPEGETPQTVMAYVYDALVDAAKPGDFMEIIGIYRASGVRVAPRLRTLKSVFRTYIDVNSLYKDHFNRLQLKRKDLEVPGADAIYENNDSFEIEQQEYTESFVKKMQNLAKDPDIYEKLIKSFAPNVWECDDVKKGLLCQLFGGTPKVIGGRMSRCDIHILLCGDPSTAKSQLLQYVHHLTPRGVYTCGRGSSAVGLTASVSRDTENREFVLESGAIVLSDKGICCIDEFDKMDESARTILHEVMEQQTISIAKAGIVCSLNARTAILASANPINSRYDTSKSVVENINLPPSLMSRFDLVYLTLDNPNANLDRSLAKHLCSLFAIDSEAKPIEPPIPRKLLEQYISYAKATCKPKLSADAGALLVEVYIELRNKGGSGERSLNATPRQLESLIRLSEALAKMQLSESVTQTHVKEAIRLIQVATYTTLIDPITGRIDFDQLNAGISGESRRRRQLLERTIINTLKLTSGSGYSRSELAEIVTEKLRRENKYSFDSSGQEFNLLLKEMEDFSIIGKTHEGKFISLVTV